jgi:hypothetical protein
MRGIELAVFGGAACRRVSLFRLHVDVRGSL